MRWADLIIMTDNRRYISALQPFFDKGYPIIGANKRSAELEMDRGLGDEVLGLMGIPTLPCETFDSFDAAIASVKRSGITAVVKCWGGTEDKSLSFVPKSPEDLIWKLERWKREAKFKGKFMLQQKAKGVEMAVAGWFGKGGFSQHVREIFEEKKFMNDGLGQNTGEMGTIIRYTDKKSLLYQKVLAPLEDYLHGLNYVGNVDVNCIVEKANPWPLEFTMRFGWPGNSIETALHLGDNFEWLYDLWEGKDTLRVKPDVACGVVMAHGDFPIWNDPDLVWAGYPIHGITPSAEKHVWPIQMMQEEGKLVTAGQCVMVVTGTGSTVEDSRQDAYNRTWKIDWPSNRMFRTDLGCRLEKGLLELQAYGFAKGMKYV